MRPLPAVLPLALLSLLASGFAQPATQSATKSAIQAAARSAPKSVPATPEAAAAELPIRRVVLYKNGVGYFEHQGRVTANQELNIRFTTAQIGRASCREDCRSRWSPYH